MLIFNKLFQLIQKFNKVYNKLLLWQLKFQLEKLRQMLNIKLEKENKKL